jgi:hypothetical protein
VGRQDEAWGAQPFAPTTVFVFCLLDKSFDVALGMRADQFADGLSAFEHKHNWESQSLILLC